MNTHVMAVKFTTSETVVRSKNQEKTSLALLEATKNERRDIAVTAVTHTHGTPDLVHLKNILVACPS